MAIMESLYTIYSILRTAIHIHLPLQWCHNERDGVSNHQPHHCLLNRLFKVQIKESIKAPRHWPLWGEFTGDFPAQRASNAENVSICDIMVSAIYTIIGLKLMAYCLFGTKILRLLSIAIMENSTMYETMNRYCLNPLQSLALPTAVDHAPQEYNHWNLNEKTQISK